MLLRKCLFWKKTNSLTIHCKKCLRYRKKYIFLKISLFTYERKVENVMTKKKHILIVLFIILVALTFSACKFSQQDNGDETSQKSSLSVSKSENSQENSADSDQFIAEENGGETSQKNTFEKTENKNASSNRAKTDNKGSSDNKGTAVDNSSTDNKGNSDDNASTDNKEQDTGDTTSQSESKLDVAGNEDIGFGSLF